MRIETTVPVKVVVEIDDRDLLRCSVHCGYLRADLCRLYKSKVKDGLRRPGCVKDIQLARPRDDAGVKDAHWHLYKNHGLTDEQLADVIALGDLVHDAGARAGLAEKWKAGGARPRQSTHVGGAWCYGYGTTRYGTGGYVYPVAQP